MRSDTMQALLLKVEKEFTDHPECATLTALSRSTVALRYNIELWCQYFLLEIAPLVENKMGKYAGSYLMLVVNYLHTS